MNNFFLSILILGSCIAQAQVGIGTTTPDPSAALEFTSTTQGFLPPRMTAAQRDVIVTPAQGLMVYCADCGSNGEAQLYNGAAWVTLLGGTAAAVHTPNVTSTTGRIWMDRNLGATQVATSSNDAASYGDLYQWGRGTDGHQTIVWATSTTSDGTEQSRETLGQSPSTSPGSDFLTGSANWYNGTNPNELWKEVGTGVNNPCPSGYRLPTETEWNAEISTWSPRNKAGAIASPLKLPTAGYRRASDGVLMSPGTLGLYWSSTYSGGNASRGLYFQNGVSVGNDGRSNGLSVRCIKD